jgi:hypothetical protein
MGQRCLPVQKFVDHESESPDVCFGSIQILAEALRRHVEWRPDVDVFELFAGVHCKPEISYFGCSVLQEYVGGFDVSVDELFCG